ncbi:MAG: LysR family transcriptional regulator, partial [Pseudomonas sp.]
DAQRQQASVELLRNLLEEEADPRQIGVSPLDVLG